MTFLSKATVAFAALSMVAAPVAASAATPKFDDLRANTELTNEAALGPDGALSAEALILLLAAIAAIIAGLVVAADGSSDTPTSPN
jgi:hypothetical protein